MYQHDRKSLLLFIGNFVSSKTGDAYVSLCVPEFAGVIFPCRENNLVVVDPFFNSIEEEDGGPPTENAPNWVRTTLDYWIFYFFPSLVTLFLIEMLIEKPFPKDEAQIFPFPPKKPLSHLGLAQNSLFCPSPNP